jgi:membrane protein DedA with SNARE-associated domain
LFAYSGAAIWVGTFLFIGYHFGDRFPEILALVDHHLKLASIVAGLLLAAWLAFRFFAKKRRANPR